MDPNQLRLLLAPTGTPPHLFTTCLAKAAEIGLTQIATKRAHSF
jgi:hypothetical protein